MTDITPDAPAAPTGAICAGCRDGCSSACPGCEIPICLICEIVHKPRCTARYGDGPPSNVLA